jgi:ribosomal protein S18 acetylase RimI-like enzyme
MSGRDTVVRPIEASEYGHMKTFIYEAIYLPPGADPLPRQVIFHPDVYIYIEDFGTKSGDICLVAELDYELVGAAWTRIIPAFGHVDYNTPELAISVLPEHRSSGIGTTLMTALFDELRKQGYRQTSLAVQHENAAVRFYQRLGYEIVETKSEEYIMIKNLCL